MGMRTMWPWLDDEVDNGASPRLRQWLMAVAILMLLSLGVPIFASFV